MNNAYSDRKVRTTVTVDGAVLEAAKAAGLNLSRTLEQALIVALKDAGREKWLRDNAAAIEDYNGQILGRGAFGADSRRF